MKQQIAEFTEVIDDEHSSFFQTKNEVMHEYFPLIGATGFSLYSFYKSMANRGAGNVAFPSFSLVRQHLGFSDGTINQYNWLLEQCHLLRITRGNSRESNVYRLLKVEPVTEELLASLTQALQPLETDGKEWARFKANRLEAVKNWQPLRAHFKAKPAPPPPVANTTTDTPPQTELVTQLVEQFKNNKLSEVAAIKMITDYGEEAVKQQLAWLPARQSDTPLRTLRAALKSDWGEPKPVGKSTIGTEMMTAPPVEARHVLSPPPDPLWQEVKERLQMQMTQATYDTWVKQTELIQVEGNQWLIQCESRFAQDWLENRLNGTLTRTVASVAGQAVVLKFVVSP